GTTVLSSKLVDRMYGALDAIRELVHEALTGEPVSVNLAAVLQQLDGENPVAPDAESLQFVPAAEPSPSVDEGAVSPDTRTPTELEPAVRAETLPLADGPAAAAYTAEEHQE